jgi:hypothetical protein
LVFDARDVCVICDCDVPALHNGLDDCDGLSVDDAFGSSYRHIGTLFAPLSHRKPYLPVISFLFTGLS